MADNNSTQQHHHHHHHKIDGATRFKRKNLLALERRKKIEKWLFRIACIIAVVMAIIAVAAYMID